MHVCQTFVFFERNILVNIFNLSSLNKKVIIYLIAQKVIIIMHIKSGGQSTLA